MKKGSIELIKGLYRPRVQVKTSKNNYYTVTGFGFKKKKYAEKYLNIMLQGVSYDFN